MNKSGELVTHRCSIALHKILTYVESVTKLTLQQLALRNLASPLKCFGILVRQVAPSHSKSAYDLASSVVANLPVDCSLA